MSSLCMSDVIQPHLYGAFLSSLPFFLQQLLVDTAIASLSVVFAGLVVSSMVYKICSFVLCSLYDIFKIRRGIELFDLRKLHVTNNVISRDNKLMCLLLPTGQCVPTELVSRHQLRKQSRSNATCRRGM